MKRCLLLLTLLLSVAASAQSRFHRRVPRLDYARFEENCIEFPADSARFDNFLRRLDTLVVTGQGKLNILHVGGSHVQGGVWTDRLRQNLLALRYGLDGGRGFVFPYAAAGTNTPSSYRSKAFGTWTSDRCLKPEGRLGLSGMSVTTSDTSSVLIDLVPNNRRFATPGYVFRRVDVFGYGDREPVLILGRDSLRGREEKGYWRFDIPHYAEYLRIAFRGSGTYTLTGVYLDKGGDGISVSEIGVNGASTLSWLNCEDWERDLRVIKPDLVIFSIGINDIQNTEFSPEAFEQRYNRLVRQVMRVNPNCALLFTTVTDSFYHRRQPNQYGVEASSAIISLAKKYNAAVWDQFTLMGGLGSVEKWAQSGLATWDLVHFTSEGYTVFGNLLFNAMMDRYSEVCR